MDNLSASLDREHATEAELFLEKEGPKIHPIFEPETASLLRRSTTMTDETLVQKTDVHTNQFIEVMEAYKESTGGPNISKFDLDGKHSWEEVLQAARDADAKYKGAGRMRKFARTIRAQSEAFVPYVELIPNEHYLSVLSGGLKLIFKAFASIEEGRDKGLKTLLRIPEVINLAEECRDNFPLDPILYDKTSKVYIAALTAIEGTTAALKKTSIKKQGKALLLGPLYNQSFKEKIFALDEALNGLKERVSILRDRVVVQTGKGVEGVDATTRVTLEHVKRLNDSYEKTDVKIDNLHDSELQEAKEQALKAMKIVLEETTKTSEWMQKKDRIIHRLKRQVQHLVKAAAALSLEDMLKILDVSAESSLQDLHRMFQARQSTDLAAYYLAEGIIKDQMFQAWLKAGDSAPLFIGGGASFSNYGRITPISIVSSTVVQYYEDEQHAVTVHFFCGRHTSLTDPLGGPQGMMRSLICQTLRWFPIKLDFIPSTRYSQQLQKLDFATLCDCFVRIVQALPAGVVLICIIDSIHVFENREWAESCRKAVNDLLTLVFQEQLDPIFKLLITSPLRSRYIKDAFPRECRMLSEADNSIGGRMEPTEREVSMAASRYRKPKESPLLQSLRAETAADSETETELDMITDSDDDAKSDTGAPSGSK